MSESFLLQFSEVGLVPKVIDAFDLGCPIEDLGVDRDEGFAVPSIKDLHISEKFLVSSHPCQTLLRHLRSSFSLGRERKVRCAAGYVGVKLAS